MLDLVLSTVSQGLLWAIMALGVFLTFRVLDIADLSVEGTFPLGAAVAATLIDAGHSVWFAMLIALIAGCIGGTVTALLTTKLKIPALLSGILTMIGLYSVNLMIMGKANVPLLRAETVFTLTENLFGVSSVVATLIVGLVATVIVGAIMYWFFGTVLGTAIRATGCNPHPLLFVLKVGHRHAVLVFQRDVVLEPEIVELETQTRDQTETAALEQCQIDRIQRDADRLGALRKTLQMIGQLQLAEVRNQPAVMDSYAGPVSVVPEKLVVAFSGAFFREIVDAQHELALVFASGTSVRIAVTVLDENFALLRDGIGRRLGPGGCDERQKQDDRQNSFHFDSMDCFSDSCCQCGSAR